MSVTVLYSRALAGMDAPLVTVEAHLDNGLPSFTIADLAAADAITSAQIAEAIQCRCFDRR